MLPVALTRTCFNSRSREGATALLFAFVSVFEVSIHAPVRERQERYEGPYKHADVSIHAPVRERHEYADLGLDDCCVSIHAPVRERPYFIVYPSNCRLFQFTLP